MRGFPPGDSKYLFIVFIDHIYLINIPVLSGILYKLGWTKAVTMRVGCLFITV